MTLTILLFVVFLCCFAFIFTEGVWGAALRLFNVVTAALLAWNLYEPAADFAEGYMSSFTYCLDYLAVWGLFALFLAIFRTLTDKLSTVKVRFLSIVDRIGGAVLAACIGLVMVGFTTASLHVAPLAQEPFRGAFTSQDDDLFFGTGADRKWLGFIQQLSMGGYSSTVSEPKQRATYKLQEGDETRVFDAAGEFLPKYYTRRARLEGHLESTGSIREHKK